MSDYNLNGLWAQRPTPGSAPVYSRKVAANNVHIVAKGTIDMKDAFVRAALQDGGPTVIAHDGKSLYLLRTNTFDAGAIPLSGKAELAQGANAGLELEIDYMDDGYGEKTP